MKIAVQKNAVAKRNKCKVPPNGTVIWVSCGAYRHYGFYADGEVFQLLGSGNVTCITLDEFRQKKRVYHDQESVSRNVGKAIEFARRHIGQGTYNLGFRNCEHFARACATGVAESKQVQQVTSNVAQVTAFAVKNAKTVSVTVSRLNWLRTLGIDSFLRVCKWFIESWIGTRRWLDFVFRILSYGLKALWGFLYGGIVGLVKELGFAVVADFLATFGGATIDRLIANSPAVAFA